MVVSTVNVRALLIGQGIDLRRFNPLSVLARDPLSLRLGEAGVAVLFRFGVVVLFGGGREDEGGLMAQLRDYVRSPFAEPDVEPLALQVIDGAVARIEEGVLIVPDMVLPLVQVIADVLAKSVLLDNYEQ